MTTPVAHRPVALKHYEWVRSVSNLMLADFPADKATFQPASTDNHAAWVLGHIICTDAWMAKELGITGISAPESYGPLFGGGSKPVSDPKAYPPFAELRTQFDATHTSLMNWYRSAPESALTTDLSARSKGFTTDPVDAILKLAWHEGWHFGQVASIRKALGLPSKLG